VLDHAMSRFRTTLTAAGSSPDQLRDHLRAVRQLLLDEPELGAVMAELALRSVRDDPIGSIMNQMYDQWLATTRGLLRNAAGAGRLAPELDNEGVAALIVATVTSLTLPVMSDPQRGDRALDQLEAWLGLTGNKSTD
jgi:hypothetical protein